MSRLSIELLGTTSIARDDVPVVELRHARVLALFAYLAVESDRPHSRAYLAELLWPDQSLERSRHNLRQAISTLRHMLGDRVATDPYLLVGGEQVAFNRQSDCVLDASVFLDLLETCRRHGHQRLEDCPACAQRLQQAVALYRGDFLQGFSIGTSDAFDSWLQRWRDRLRTQAVDAAFALATWHARRDALVPAVAALHRLVELDPWHDAANRLLLDLLWRQGKRAEALAHYETYRRLLDDELGVDPEAETTDLYKAIAAAGSRPPPVRDAAGSLPGGQALPVPPNRLVGRERELAEIGDLLGNSDCRLLTLVGPGGSGKTRLAIELLATQSAPGLDRPCFVPLADVPNPDDVPQAIAVALGLNLPGKGDPLRHLFDWARDRRLLLVLDNVEHLVEGMGLLARLLAVAPGVTVLATSRERLQLRDEWVYEVRGLDVPASDLTDSFEGYGAVMLFCERLRQLRPATPLRHDEHTAVIRICQLVDGLPLALELAANWAQSLSVDQIAAELGRDPDFLSTTLRDVPARHRSMRTVFEQTWRMMTPEERSTYWRLSIFVEGFGFEAAHAVTGVSAAQLSALVSKALLGRAPEGRYRLHNLLRQFAAERARQETDDYPRLADAHARHYLTMLADQAPELTGAAQHLALRHIEPDFGNIRAAWAWAIGRADLALIRPAVHALWLFFVMRGWMRDGASAFGLALATLPGAAGLDTPEGEILLASITARRGGFLSGLGHYDEGIELMDGTLDTFRRRDARGELALTLNMLASAHRQRGNLLEAKRLLEDSLTAYRDIDDTWGIAYALNDLGLVHHLLGDNERARQFGDEARPMLRAIGDRRGSAFATYNLGLIASTEGNHERARSLFQESLALRQDTHDVWGTAASLVQLGTESRVLGRPREARTIYRQALRISRASGITPVLLEALLGIADLDGAEGNRQRAVRIATAVARHPASRGHIANLIDERIANPMCGPATVVDDGQAPAAVDRLVREMID